MKFYKANPNKVVPDPENGFIPFPVFGRFLPDPLPSYWVERLNDGDIYESVPEGDEQ